MDTASDTEARSYLLQQDQAEIDRLNQQHHLFTASLDGRGTIVEPSVPIASLETVLEIATGTGIWLQELFTVGAFGQQLPSKAKGVGWDITLDKLDTAARNNSRLTFAERDALDEPRPDEIASFDLVHLRLLVLGLSLSQYRRVVQHCFTLLKPRGYLQLCETDDIYKPLDEQHPDVMWRRLRQCYEIALASHKNTSTELVDAMLPAVEDAGFRIIKTEDVDLPVGPKAAEKLHLPNKLGLDWAKVTHQCIVSLKEPFLSAGGSSEVNTSDQYESLIRDSEHFHTTSGYYTRTRLITARKPVE